MAPEVNVYLKYPNRKMEIRLMSEKAAANSIMMIAFCILSFPKTRFVRCFSTSLPPTKATISENVLRSWLFFKRSSLNELSNMIAKQLIGTKITVVDSSK